MKEIQLEEMWGKINKALTSENKTFLESKTAKILPNNPTSQGFSADQIRKSLYEGILVLFEWLKTTNNSNVDFNNKVMETLTAITENNEEDKQDLANLKQSLIDGTFNVKYLTFAVMATNDENGNRIIDTYATIERLTKVLEALTQEISDRKAADDLEKKERKEETSAIINSVNQEISDRTNAVSVLNNLLTTETENRTSEDEKVLQYAQSVNEALGNAKTDLQGKIDSEAQTRLTSDNEIKASITSKEDSLKALINSVKNELNGSITTLSNRVNNLPTNYVFDTYESMTNDLLNASNTKYKVGDTLFIKEVNKPDYWVSAILSTKGTYGYYELSIQESKVDLSNYVKISELSREAIEEKFLETVENGRTKSFAARSFAATSRNSGIDLNNYAEYGYDGVSFHKNGMEYPLGFPKKDGVFALISDIPQTLKNPFALTINGKVYDGSSAVSITTETITEHDLVRFWHAGIEIQNDGSEHVLRFSDFDTELEEFSPHISCQYDGPQYYWVWKFPQISGTFAMESQIPTKLSQLTNDGNYQTNTSDLKDNTTTFTTASERSNVASGEKLSVSFGKIAKYFNDLKAVAFSGNKADVGLGNVDNTSDADKPVSNATQQALNNKANSSDVYTKSETDNKINKPLYNLGAYDTISGNVITRQTGYVDLGSLEWNIGGSEGSWTGLYFRVNLLQAKFISLNQTNAKVSSRYNVVGRNSIDNDLSLCIDSDGNVAQLQIKDNSFAKTDEGIAQFKVSLQGIMLQYELVDNSHYTEEIIEGQPLITLDQQGSQWLRDEWEKGLNLLNTFDRSNIPTDSSFYNATLNSDGSYTSNATSDTRGWVYSNSDFKMRLTKGTYYLSVTGVISNDYNVAIEIYDNNSKLLVSTSRTNNFKASFKLASDTDVGIIGKIYNSSNIKIMLNEGDHPYPYQPYNQNKHITNNEAVFLKSEAERSANLIDIATLSGTTTNQAYFIVTTKDITSILENNGERNYIVSAKLSNVPSNAISAIEIKRDWQYWKGTQITGNGNLIVSFTYEKGYTYQLVIYGNYASGNGIEYAYTFSDIMLNEGSTALPYQAYEGKVVHEGNLKTINGNSIVGSGDLSITSGIFTKLGNKTNFSFDSGSYLVVANNGLVTIKGEDPLNGSSANKKFVGIFMVTIAEYGGGQSVCVNTEEVFSGEAASATISGPMFTIYKLN